VKRVAKVLDERGNRASELKKREQANRMLKINIMLYINISLIQKMFHVKQSSETLDAGRIEGDWYKYTY
jgi:hypothetical protein